MWSGSTRLALDGRSSAELWGRTAITLPALGAAAAAEVATYRSTVFSIPARG